MYNPIYEDTSLHSWQVDSTSTERETLINTLESGQLLFFPQLNFSVLPEEKFLLTPDLLDPKSKNISFNLLNHEIRGTRADHQQIKLLHNMMQRFATQAQQLIYDLFPHYKNNLKTGRTSYRPAEVSNRKTSYRKDDRRLHVDAFPSSPNQGQRILRVFSNINPHQQARVWRIGEPFPVVAKKFLPQIKKPLRSTAHILHLLKITKSLRTEYDHIMLKLHNKMKADENYQQQAQQIEFHFPADSSWIVQTDQVSHAAMSGQHLLEQTFYLPVEAMQNPQLSPLKILETLTGRHLI